MKTVKAKKLRMKPVSILINAKRIEETVTMIRKPTRKKRGYAMKLTGNPTIKDVLIKFELIEISSNFMMKERINGKQYKLTNKINGKRYKVTNRFQFPVSVAGKIRKHIKRLLG